MLPGSPGIPTKRRKCPVCGYLQSVSIILHQDPVVCRRCGASIPPPPGFPAPPPKHENKQ